MRFWKRFRSPDVSPDELREADMLEAYTCWLKNEKLSRKQKRLLKEIHSFDDLQALKQLIDFSHYRFEEGEHVALRPGAVQRAKAQLFAEIIGETTQSEPDSSGALQPQPGYSPHAMGNMDTDVLPIASATPTEDTQRQWDSEKPIASRERLQLYNAIRTLSRLHVRFELKDNDVYVTDLGGSDATYVNGKRVEDTTILHNGATLKCGKVSFKIDDIDRS